MAGRGTVVGASDGLDALAMLGRLGTAGGGAFFFTRSWLAPSVKQRVPVLVKQSRPEGYRLSLDCEVVNEFRAKGYVGSLPVGKCVSLPAWFDMNVEVRVFEEEGHE